MHENKVQFPNNKKQFRKIERAEHIASNKP